MGFVHKGGGPAEKKTQEAMPAKVFTLQEIKDLTPGKYVTEGEYIGRRLGVSFGIQLLQTLGVASIDPRAKMELQERLKNALSRDEKAQRSPKVIVGWYNGLYGVLQSLPNGATILAKIIQCFPADAVRML